MNRKLSEKEFQAQITTLARLRRWDIYHTFFSVRSAPGFPDLTLCRPPRLLFVEVKTDMGKLTIEQDDWLARLRACGARALVWRPVDWPSIELELA